MEKMRWYGGVCSHFFEICSHKSNFWKISIFGAFYWFEASLWSLVGVQGLFLEQSEGLESKLVAACHHTFSMYEVHTYIVVIQFVGLTYLPSRTNSSRMLSTEYFSR